MFRALAEYIMRGRVTAVSIALIGSWVPLLTQTSVGLVTLRKGWQEGLIVALWALMPALIGLWIGDVGAVMVYSSVAVILVSYGLSWMLRLTVSWPATLAAMVALSTLAALIVYWASPNIIEDITTLFSKLVQNSEQADGTSSAELMAWVQQLNGNLVVSLIAFWVAVSAFAGLLVARWWQAMLYNPGGFREEIHGLRLNSSIALVCFVAVIYCLAQGSSYQFWANLFSLPLLFAGIGLVHCALAKYKMGIGVYIALYIVLFLMPPLGLVISVFGFSDVWLDYRKRFNLV